LEVIDKEKSLKPSLCQFSLTIFQKSQRGRGADFFLIINQIGGKTMKANVFFALLEYAEKKGFKTMQELEKFLKGGKKNV